MQKVKSLVEKLNQQINAEAGPAMLLSTVKMLEDALGAELGEKPLWGDGPIVVDVPRFFVIENNGAATLAPETKKEEEAAAIVTIHPLSYIERVNEPLDKEPIVKETAQPAAQTTVAAVPAVEAKMVEETKLVTDVAADATTDHEVSKTEEISTPENLAVNEEEEPAQRIVEDLIIDEAEIEAELEQIKEKADTINKISSHVNPVLTLDFDTEIPTFAHQPHFEERQAEKSTELNEIAGRQNTSYSVNEKLKTEKAELSEQLVDNTPIKDLRKAISVNDKFTFLHDLFRNDEAMYNRSLKTINNFSIYPEAEFWIRRELKVKLGWDEKTEAVKLFDQYVRRRFS